MSKYNIEWNKNEQQKDTFNTMPFISIEKKPINQ